MRTFDAIFKLAVRIAAAVVVAVFAGVLLVREIAPTGRLTLMTDLIRPAASIGDPKPNDRISLPSADDRAGRAAIIGSPLFIDLAPPSDFDQVTVTTTYANEGQPLVLVGALSSATDRRYDVRAAESALLDALPWKRVVSGRLALYARRGDYASVDAFFGDPPAPSRVAVLGAVPSLAFHGPGGLQPRSRTVSASLRGAHRFIAYVDNAPLHMSLTIQDMNRHAGKDPIMVTAYRLGDDVHPVASATLADDGNTEGDQRSSKLRVVELATPALAAGAYAIDVSATDDAFIRSFETDAAKLVVAGRLYLGDFIGYSDRVPKVTVYASGEQLTATTDHPESAQTLRVGSSGLALADITPHSIAIPAGFVPVTSTKRDVLLETGGVFAFSKDDAFSPLPLGIGWHTTPQSLGAAGIDYVLAEYETPARTGNDAAASVTFDTATLARTKAGAYRFVIDAPALGAVPGALRVANVTFMLRRQSQNGGITSFLSAFFRRGETPPRVAVKRGAIYDDAVD